MELKNQNSVALISILQDLIKINNDRKEGYNKAIKHAKNNVALQTLFNYKVKQSIEFVGELENLNMEVDRRVLKKTTMSGKIYRGWMDFKNVFKPYNTTFILESCLHIEEKAIANYNSALSSNTEMNSDTRKLIFKQYQIIIKARNEIETLKIVSQKLS